MALKIKNLIGKLEIHYHGGEQKINGEELQNKISEIFLNILKKGSMLEEMKKKDKALMKERLLLDDEIEKALFQSPHKP